jgi:hypothetical protein
LPDADGDGYSTNSRAEWSAAKSFSSFLRPFPEGCGAAVSKRYQELLCTMASHAVLRSNQLLNSSGELLQNLVASQMTMNSQLLR